MQKSFVTLTVAALAASAAMPAAAKDAPVQLQKCEQSLGTIAIVEGDTQGWSEYDLGSPRELINTLALESGCFTPHSAASGRPADFLMNVIAGDSEVVDQSINIAKSAITEGLVRSGAAGSVLSRVPVGGALLSAFGGLGGKKKRLAAGIKLLSPASGMAIATGSCTVTKSSLTFGGGNAWTAVTRPLMLSHWRVRDDAAAYLSAATVRGAGAGLDRAEALRRAQLALIDSDLPDAAHPAVWAPFVLVEN